jgi:hypothetical protein
MLRANPSLARGRGSQAARLTARRAYTEVAVAKPAA